jgi:hypothetical protein
MNTDSAANLKCVVGKLYQLRTSEELDNILCYEGRRPFAVGDIVYCQREIGKSGALQLSRVKVGARQEIRLEPYTEFAFDRGLHEIGELPFLERLPFEGGKPVSFPLASDAAKTAMAGSGSRLAYVEPGDVVLLNTELQDGEKPRYAFVLDNTGGDNPKLKLAEKMKEGPISRYRVHANELQNASVLSDASVDRFESGREYIMSWLQPGTILRLSEPLSFPGVLGIEWESGRYALLEQVIGRRSRDGVTLKMIIQEPGFGLKKVRISQWFLPPLEVLN